MTKTKPQKDLPGAQSLNRAFALLRAVARHNQDGARLSVLAREVDLHVATARRLLSVLSLNGFTSYDPVTKLYRLGMALYHLGSSAQQFTIRDQFHSILEKIAQETEDTVFLMIRSGFDGLCIDRVEGRFPIRALMIDVGVSRPLGIGAGSLALIGFLPPEQFESVLQVNDRRFPDFNGLDSQTIRKLAAESLDRGYVVSEELFWPGVSSVGVPIRSPEGGIIAAITVAAISTRMSRQRQRTVAGIIMRNAGQIVPETGL